MIHTSNKLVKGFNAEVPSIYQIEVMSRCNFKCQFCQTGMRYDDRERFTLAAIKPTLFYKIIERDLEGSEFIELQYRGEPTLNKNLNHYVMALREKVFTGFSTHGNLLNQEFAMQAALNSHYITISIDAGEKETYEKLRIGGDWDILLANITELIKRKGKNIYPIIDLQLIEFDGFEDQLSKLKIVDEQLGWTQSAGKTLRYRTIKDTQAVWTQNWKEEVPNNSLCTNPWYSVSIKSNGDVVPCCLIFDDIPDLVYGNLNDASLKEIWDSLKVRQFRTAHRHGFLPPHCRACYARSPHNLHKNLLKEIYQLVLRNPHDL